MEAWNHDQKARSLPGCVPAGKTIVVLILSVCLALGLSAVTYAPAAMAKKAGESSARTEKKGKAQNEEVTREYCDVKCQSSVRGNPLFGGGSPNMDWVALGIALVLTYFVGYGVFFLRVRGGGYPLPCAIFSLAIFAFLLAAILPFIFGYRGVSMVATESGPACWCAAGVSPGIGDYVSRFSQFNWPIWIAVMAGTLLVGGLMIVALGRSPSRQDDDSYNRNEEQ